MRCRDALYTPLPILNSFQVIFGCCFSLILIWFNWLFIAVLYWLLIYIYKWFPIELIEIQSNDAIVHLVIHELPRLEFVYLVYFIAWWWWWWWWWWSTRWSKRWWGVFSLIVPIQASIVSSAVCAGGNSSADCPLNAGPGRHSPQGKAKLWRDGGWPPHFSSLGSILSASASASFGFIPAGKLARWHNCSAPVQLEAWNVQKANHLRGLSHAPRQKTSSE